MEEKRSKCLKPETLAAFSVSEFGDGSRLFGACLFFFF